MNQCGLKNCSEILTEPLALIIRLHYFPPAVKDQDVENANFVHHTMNSF